MREGIKGTAPRHEDTPLSAPTLVSDDALVAAELPREHAGDMLFVPHPDTQATHSETAEAPAHARTIDAPQELRATKAQDLDEDGIEDALEESGRHLTGWRKWLRIGTIYTYMPAVIIAGFLTPTLPVGLFGSIIGIGMLVKAVGIKKAVHDITLAARRVQLGIENFFRGISFSLLGDQTTVVLDDGLKKGGELLGKYVGKPIARRFKRLFAHDTTVGTWASKTWAWLQKVFPDPNVGQKAGETAAGQKPRGTAA